MTQPLTPTQADINAASELICDQSLCDCEKCMAEFSQAFARHAQAARLEGAGAMQEAAAKECDRVAFEDRVNVNKGWKPITGNLAGGYCANAIRDLDPLSIAEKGV